MDMNLRLDIGAVVIGRNEGGRLVACLNSIVGQLEHIVYVDSNSTDDSVEQAKQLGVKTVSLDLSVPFTAARARNEGARFLLNLHPEVKMIQFIDGDCEVQPGWLDKAYNFLLDHNDYAVVCGRRRERNPQDSIYNQLCDIEWDTPVGESLACGGDALIRVDSYNQVNGYRDDLIAGEEPEMCFRLRSLGWKIRRLDTEMTLHDASMLRFSQWWKRTVRAGYAFTLGSSIHGGSSERFWVRECQRIMIWGLVFPILVITLSNIYLYSLLLLLMYPLQILRVSSKRPDLGKTRFIWATSIVIGKFAEAAGMIRFCIDRVRNKKAHLIEYK